MRAYRAGSPPEAPPETPARPSPVSRWRVPSHRSPSPPAPGAASAAWSKGRTATHGGRDASRSALPTIYPDKYNAPGPDAKRSAHRSARRDLPRLDGLRLLRRLQRALQIAEPALGRARRSALDGAVAADQLFPERCQFRAAALRAARPRGRHRLVEALVHVVDEKPGSPVRHAERTPRLRDRAGVVDGLEQPHLPRPDRTVGAEIHAQGQSGVAHRGSVRIAAAGYTGPKKSAGPRRWLRHGPVDAKPALFGRASHILGQHVRRQALPAHQHEEVGVRRAPRQAGAIVEPVDAARRRRRPDHLATSLARDLDRTVDRETHRAVGGVRRKLGRANRKGEIRRLRVGQPDEARRNRLPAEHRKAGRRRQHVGRKALVVARLPPRRDERIVPRRVVTFEPQSVCGPDRPSVLRPAVGMRVAMVSDLGPLKRRVASQIHSAPPCGAVRRCVRRRRSARRAGRRRRCRCPSRRGRRRCTARRPRDGSR